MAGPSAVCIHTLGLTLEQWGIVYGMLFSTVSVVLHAVSKWRSRGRLRITAYESLTERAEAFPDGFHERYEMIVTIKNMGREPVVVESWGMVPTKGTGPLAVEITGLPARLEQYESVKITQHNTQVFLREPSRIYAEDAGRKRWWASRKDTREAVVAAKRVVDWNNNRQRTTLPGGRSERPADASER